MRDKLALSVFPAVAILLLVPGSSYGHHAHRPMSSYEKLVCVTGVVIEHQFINPHQIILVEVSDGNGNTDAWAGYGGSVGMERRIGWHSKMFNIRQDRITMCGFPYKDGRKIMIYVKMTRDDGEELPIYATLQGDLIDFMEENKVRSFEEIPESLIVNYGR